MHIGIDLGGTNIAAAIVSEQGEILKRVSFPTNAKGGEQAVLQGIYKACETLLEGVGEPLRSIGIGSPGIVRGDLGLVAYSSNLPLKNTDMTGYLRDKYSCEVFLGNDANCAALGEAIAGSGNGCKNFALITLGTGVGSGFIVDGKMLTGFNGAGGESGHIVILDGGRKCGCGRLGCWEAYASATGLVTTALEFMEKDPKSVMWELCAGAKEKVEGRTVFDAFRKGDAAAKQTVDIFIKHLAAGIANLINIFQPEILCVGGGISNAWDCIEEPLNKAVVAESFTSCAPDVPQTKLARATLGNDAGIIGAALLGSFS